MFVGYGFCKHFFNHHQKQQHYFECKTNNGTKVLKFCSSSKYIRNTKKNPTKIQVNETMIYFSFLLHTKRHVLEAQNLFIHHSLFNDD